MNWLERARREIGGTAQRSTANSAERNPTAVTAAPFPSLCGKVGAFIGGNGSPPWREFETMQGEFEERAAIMEFDGGLSRDEAERAALDLFVKKYRLH